MGNKPGVNILKSFASRRSNESNLQKFAGKTGMYSDCLQFDLFFFQVYFPDTERAEWLNKVEYSTVCTV